MTQHDIDGLCKVAHYAAVSVLDQEKAETMVIGLTLDSRYTHKWTDINADDHEPSGVVELVKAGAMAITTELLDAGVRQFMPLRLPSQDCLAAISGFRDNRISVRLVAQYLLFPEGGLLPPGTYLRIDIAGLKPA